MVSTAEAVYMQEPTQGRLVEWQEATCEYRSILTAKTRKNLLAQRRRIFEFGDKNGSIAGLSGST